MKTTITILFYLFACFNAGARSNKTILSSVLVNPELKEHFVDSLNVGRRKLNKIELSLYNSDDSSYVVIKFYSRTVGKHWKLKQTFLFGKDGVLGLNTKLSDFNNDGFKDLTYISDVAARGANEIRRLFIYDKTKDQMICIKNSEDYPNMLYNKQLNCIDAFLVYGGSSTIFLRIKGDRLKEFAAVDLENGLTVYTIGKNGKRKIIRRDKTVTWGYVRFINYSPLIPYDKY